MAGLTFRNWSSYTKSGRKVSLATTGKIDSESNSELIIVDGQVAGSSHGVPTTNITIDAYTCAEGNDATQVIRDMHLSREWQTFTFGIVDGAILSCECMVKSISYSTDSAKGTATMSATMQGKQLSKVG